MKANAAEAVKEGRGGGEAVVRGYIRRVWPLIGGSMPEALTAEGLMAAVSWAMEREPWLARVTPESLVRAVVTAERLGLPPGEARLVPYRDRESGRLECLLRLRQGEAEQG